MSDVSSSVEDTSSAPVRSRICFAFFVQAESSQWTDRRIPPSLTRSSYLWASYSGIPIPTKAPVTPLTAPPTVAPTAPPTTCLLYTSDAADERSSVDLGGRRII